MTQTPSATLIRNGRVITATDDYVADVLLKDGIVHTIGHRLEVGPDVAMVDASGLYVLYAPGKPPRVLSELLSVGEVRAALAGL